MKSFLNSLSKCLSCGHQDMMQAGLTTVVWLSSSLALLPESEYQLYAFLVLITKLKQNVVSTEGVEQKKLAETSLLRFSRIPS